MDPEIGIIGGTGSVPMEMLEDREEVKIHTPYGSPSDHITLGTLHGRRIAVLSRHGKGHSIQPSNINARANIWALKDLGVTHVLSTSTVGSLQDEKKPGEFVFVDQFIDRTHKRASTFYDGSMVSHISVAEPFCPTLRGLYQQKATELELPFHGTGTYICIEGPRFSTRAESRMFRSWGGDVIGMTLVPECVLAREAELCYATIAMVTDYDTFKEQPVTIEEVFNTMKENEEHVRELLTKVVAAVPQERTCECKDALKNALL